MENLVSIIFEEPPEKWGLRGDPYLWDDLKKYFKNKVFPYPKATLINDIHRIFEDITGEELGTREISHVPEYEHGGMSSGDLSHAFWHEKALPLILSRLDYYNYKAI